MRVFDKCEDALRAARDGAVSYEHQAWGMTAAVIKTIIDNTESPHTVDDLTRILKGGSGSAQAMMKAREVQK